MFKVELYQTQKDRPARRGVPALKAGSVLYVLRYTEHNGYYPWSYTYLDTARIIAQKVAKDPEFKHGFNIVASPEVTKHSCLKPKDLDQPSKPLYEKLPYDAQKSLLEWAAECNKDQHDLEKMSARQLFNAWCEWNGLLGGWDHILWDMTKILHEEG